MHTNTHPQQEQQQYTHTTDTFARMHTCKYACDSHRGHLTLHHTHHKPEARAQQRKQRQKILQTRENGRNKKKHPRRHACKQQQQHRASPGVADRLATASIQNDTMHTTIQGTKRIPNTNEGHPQAFKHTQSHTTKTTCMQTATCNISCTKNITLLIATSCHITQLQP